MFGTKSQKRFFGHLPWRIKDTPPIYIAKSAIFKFWVFWVISMHLIILYVIDIHNVMCFKPFLPLYDHFTIWRFLVRNWQYKLKPCHIYIFLIAFLSLISFDQIVLSHIWARTFDIGSPFPTTWPDIWLKWLWWTTIQLREWMPSLFRQHCCHTLFVNQY